MFKNTAILIAAFVGEFIVVCVHCLKFVDTCGIEMGAKEIAQYEKEAIQQFLFSATIFRI